MWIAFLSPMIALSTGIKLDDLIKYVKIMFIGSLIENMFEESKKWNGTPYHPFLDNYPLYRHLSSQQQVPYNKSDLSFVSQISKGQLLRF